MRSIVYYYTHLEQQFADLTGLLAGDPGTWLPAPAEPVEGGWRVAVHADGALPRRLGAGHPTQVSVGPVTATDSKLLRSITWRSATKERLVPGLEGDLELMSLEGYGCQLSLMGSYRPPMSVIGEAGDRLVGHRVAEACVRRFVLDLAKRLESATAHA